MGESVHPTARAIETVDRPTTAPTEMSSPPEMITMVWAVARTPKNRDRLTDVEDIAEEEEDVRPEAAEDRNKDHERDQQAEIVRPDTLNRATETGPARASAGRGNDRIHIQPRHCALAGAF